MLGGVEKVVLRGLGGGRGRACIGPELNYYMTGWIGRWGERRVRGVLGGRKNMGAERSEGWANPSLKALSRKPQPSV